MSQNMSLQMCVFALCPGMFVLKYLSLNLDMCLEFLTLNNMCFDMCVLKCVSHSEETQYCALECVLKTCV